MESMVRFAGKWFFPLSFLPLENLAQKIWKTTWKWHAPQHPALYPPLPPPMTISPRVTIRTQARRAMVAVAVCWQPRNDQVAPKLPNGQDVFWLSMVRLAVHFVLFRGMRATSDFCSLVLVGSLLKNRVWKSLIFQIRPPPTGHGHHHFANMCAFNHQKKTGKILEMKYN